MPEEHTMSPFAVLINDPRLTIVVGGETEKIAAGVPRNSFWMNRTRPQAAPGQATGIGKILPATNEQRTMAMDRAIAADAPGSTMRSVKETVLPHFLRAGMRSWGATGSAIGAAAGALDPGTDEEGHRRSTLSGALRGATRGAIVGAAGGAAAKHIGNRMIAPHLADVRAGIPAPGVPGASPTAGATAAPKGMEHVRTPGGGKAAPFDTTPVEHAQPRYDDKGVMEGEGQGGKKMAAHVILAGLKLAAVYDLTKGNIQITRQDMAPAAKKLAPPIVPGTSHAPTTAAVPATSAVPATPAAVLSNQLPPAPASPVVHRKGVPTIAGARLAPGPALIHK